MKQPLKNALNGRLYFDGGMGSLLLDAGINRTETASLLFPETVEKIHRAYKDAGSSVITANTFSCNSRKVEKERLRDVITRSVSIARKVAADDGYVLYDCGPTGVLPQPAGEYAFDEIYELFRQQAEIVKDLDVDGVLLETFGDLQELRAGILAFRENTDLPVLCSMSFEPNGRSFTGTSVESYALTVQGLGVDAVGINCGTGPDAMLNNVKRLVAVSEVPVIVQPNAGIPVLCGGRTRYQSEPKSFAERMRKICLSGVNVLGGCCGTTPEHIAETIKRTQDLPIAASGKIPDAVCSYARVVPFGEKSLVIGERLNPTGKPLLKRAILEKDFDYISSVCIAEKEEGADVLDVNLGMAGCDEEEMLPRAAVTVQGVTGLPLCIDTTKVKALEKAVRVTAGKCIVNSVNGSLASMQAVFPVVKKYGCYVVALCLDENGIPDTEEGRLSIAERILQEGEKYGVGKERFLFDPLTMAVSVDQKNGLFTLSVLEKLQKQFGVKTTLGLSNISFGLPNREKINACFYKMALEKGASSAIVNPTLRPVFHPEAYDLLTGQDVGCVRYVERCGTQEEKQESKKSLRDCIVRGMTKEAVVYVSERANEKNYQRILDEDVIGGLNELGKKFSDGVVFLPQLIAGSETAKAVLEYIRTRFIPEGEASRATVLLATVQGDVHDIGKNICKAVIANYGFKIIDLGKDVPCEKIVEGVRTFGAEVVGLSALMTTTLDSMERTAKTLMREFPSLTIIVGGAVVSKEFADGIGVLYSKDAREMAEILHEKFPSR